MIKLPPPTDEATRTKYQTWLNEARQAYHDLTMGTRVRVLVDQNGERIEYDRSTSSDLYAWITALENALNVTLAASRRPRPIGFTF